MKSKLIDKVKTYVESNISDFHKKRLAKLESLKLKDVIRRKNPYLFKAKNVQIASEIVKGILDAYISSSEEGIFGDWLEGLAIFVNQEIFSGRKSGIPGVDLEFDFGGFRNIVSIKSGPDWGNDSQVKKMLDNFNSARKVLKTSGSVVHVKAVNGCCYGRSNSKFEYKAKGDYYKLCGQSFWTFISGEKELYKELIEPLGYKAQIRNDEYSISYAKILNKFTAEFSKDFCTASGDIDWDKLVEFTSGKK